MTQGRLSHGRVALAIGFFVQGVVFALLVTRIPAIQDRYGISDALLPAFLAAVPVVAGVGSVAAEHLVKRVFPSGVLRWSQVAVCLALVGVGSGRGFVGVGIALAAFGLAVGMLDASMNMLGVSLQRAYGRSIMLSFHAAYSLGGIVGASLAWAGAHWDLSLVVLYGPVVAVLLPLSLVASRWYVNEDRPAAGPQPVEAPAGAKPVSGKLLLPLCLVMAFAYIGDSTVSNWSAKYLQDVLGSSEQLATVPYNVYMVTTLLGRIVGDVGVRRFGAAAVVRVGTVGAALGFAAVALAPGAWSGIAGFTLLGLGLCVIVPQTFAAAGRLFPHASDTAVARLNIFNYVGFLVGSPLVGALGDAWSYRGAMLVPMVLVLVTLAYASSFEGRGRYGGGHEWPRAVDVG
ncbi:MULTISPECIES: MFS transporter [unclassified Streptomyces]|uniref:MFS transporter n=1 Tax=unclassified Streptomyces TaxID=2593676 RepID=UPI002DD886B3|nr:MULTISPECIES: MFS transporter [unclassified Streptomyces]WSA93153.1 MFS transporter [Streptomyces sp. NBC_01795]WSB77524.1 MFS transporter [Streptomyces sp. NBC_01775]WSS14210.1 MFS transporter [Streptomyces sp. NBC_01186]WSS43031.1 MFS transporter [Streptomyces sp. NBC_01187]